MPGNQFQRMVFAFITVVITVHVNIFYSIYVVSRKSCKTNHSSTGSRYRRACSLSVFAIFGIEEIRTEQIISAKPYSQHSLLLRWKLLLR